jgi:hypothetical protein
MIYSESCRTAGNDALTVVSSRHSAVSYIQVSNVSYGRSISRGIEKKVPDYRAVCRPTLNPDPQSHALVQTK